MNDSHARQLLFFPSSGRQRSIQINLLSPFNFKSSFFVLIFFQLSFEFFKVREVTRKKSEMEDRRFRVLNLMILYSTELLLLLLMITPTAKAVWIDLPSSGTKCISEEIQRNVVVLADYYVIGDAEVHSERLPTISVKVTSPYGNNLHHHENETNGQFAFTTTEDGNYLACFWVDGNHQGDKGVTVGIDWKTGIAAKDWDSVAKKEKIEGIELELQKLEGHVQSIHDNLIYLKKRESEMREVSEKTNARVAWFSIMSIGVCVAVSLIQIFYLKNYFQKKKLI